MAPSRKVIPIQLLGACLALGQLALGCGTNRDRAPGGRRTLQTPPKTGPAGTAWKSFGQTRWWTRGGESCPRGAKPRGIVDSEVWCAQSSGTRHGRYTYWSHRGYRYYDGYYENGLKHGRWVFWQKDRKQWVTRMYRRGKLQQRQPLWGVGKRPLSCAGTAGDCDGDGIPDLADLCPADQEDKDGFHDDDGCPEVDIDHACPVESSPCPPPIHDRMDRPATGSRKK